MITLADTRHGKSNLTFLIKKLLDDFDDLVAKPVMTGREKRTKRRKIERQLKKKS